MEKSMNYTMRLASIVASAALALVLPAHAVASSDTTLLASAANAPVNSAEAVSQFFVVLPADGRIYAFGDLKNYTDYRAHGEVALTRTRISAGPGGKTVVFGITKTEAESSGSPSLAERIFDGRLGPASDFHGEVFKDGRFYVFGDLKDMMAYTAFGEVPYSYTDIAAGPNGETLVWVMNKDSFAKGRPVATIERFRALRAAK